LVTTVTFAILLGGRGRTTDGRLVDQWRGTFRGTLVALEFGTMGTAACSVGLLDLSRRTTDGLLTDPTVGVLGTADTVTLVGCA
jgi:hypothetical protein